MVKVYEDRFPAGIQGTRTAGYYMNVILQKNLDAAKKAIRQDWDMVFVIDGAEGAGKSVLAQQIAYYCDPDFNINNIVFRPHEFKEAILESKKYQAVVYDEAFGGLASRRAMSATNVAIVDMLTEIRQKNLFVIIVLPTFFDLDKYVALWRSRILIHVYADNFERGNFKFYSYNLKKKLYVGGKKFYNYNIKKPNFRGAFTNFYPVGADEYKKRKHDSLRSFEKNEEKKIVDPENKKQTIISQTLKKIAQHMFYDQTKLKLNKKQIGELMGMRAVQIGQYCDREISASDGHARFFVKTKGEPLEKNEENDIIPKLRDNTIIHKDIIPESEKATQDNFEQHMKDLRNNK